MSMSERWRHGCGDIQVDRVVYHDQKRADCQVSATRRD